MRKITFLFTLFLTTSLMYGQVVLSEDFEAGTDIPATWTNNDIAGGGEVWSIGSTGDAVGFTAGNAYLYDLSAMDGNYAILDSDAYGSGTAENVALTSPQFDTSGLTTLTLSFNHFFSAGYGGVGYVEVTTNGFAWVPVATFDGDDLVADSVYGYVTLDVSTELAGSATAQVRFRWVGDYSWGWAFDNVTVFQCTESVPNAPTLTSPANGATDITVEYAPDTNTVGPFEWDAAVTGDVATSYNFSIGTNPEADNIGPVDDFTSGNSLLYGFAPGTTYYWYVVGVNCAGSSVTSEIFSFTTAACTETALPAEPSAPVPADAAPSVDLSETPEGGLSFSWAEGGPDDVYILNIGTANPPTQSFDWENGDVLSGLSVSTTYYWSVDVANCFGVTEGPVWSFTTGDVLSIEDNELETPLSVYPNPTSGILNIKSNQDVDTVAVFNLLGQNVASFTKSSIIDSSVNLSELSNGLYLVKITSGDKTQTIRVTKE
ncbi:T9SS type A sorting domain-containing protein [Winogradskyella psychrotolerans]|uniref:T9SS type A sorting domain-containing protein n=1 Tax=Winogradskyella psychrotolerans TaxID=1344585 RepID=UPI001C07DAFF|nr:T9SS type A sorting domain-containing protein [Winogradskyella psychrotolerans]MBU2929193.1 T9SS type A sorting domain-containing protein [Winogradskyella psychrotolerans]